MANVIIHGGTFNSAQGDFHINNNDLGLNALRGVSLGAIHDSGERYPPPNCHPDTRKAVRQIILDWIHSESLAYTFFWLYGSAGAGKTAILQAIAEFLCNSSGSGRDFFGGSFFFSRGKQGRDQGQFLFTTIVYQLALKVPGLRQHVNRIIELNPTLHTKSMDVQLRTLIVDAFQNLSPLPQRSYLVIIDGLDECHDKATQQLILRLLCEAITDHKLPLRFLIGSRPESHIRDSFDQESLYTVTRRVILDETFDPGRDIQVFLQDGFAEICPKNPIMSHVEQPWPGECIIDLLVQRSSGQFIYAATVLKFVGADFCSPTKQLALVLKPDSTAFSDLDQLYTQILSVYPSSVNIVQVLGFIFAVEWRLLEVTEDILEMEEGHLKLVLRGLSSLMDGNGDVGECLNKRAISYLIPHFAHASFRDFLFDSSRSGLFYVNRQKYEEQVTIRSFALILQSIRSGRMSSITRDLHIATWYYFTSCLPVRFTGSPEEVKEVIMTDIEDLVQEFWSTSSDGAASIFATRRLHEILRRCLVLLECKSDQITAKFKILSDECRKMFDQSLSKSKDLGDLLRFLPGVVVQKRMSIQVMAVLYRIKPDLLERLVKSTLKPLKPLPYSCYLLDDYLSGYLQDRNRSQLYYCDPILHHIYICRHILSFLDRSNVFDFQSHDLSNYVRHNFYNHLCAASAGFLYGQISDDHSAVEFLRDLETTAYYVDENWPGYFLAHLIIKTILSWANMLNCHLKGLAVSVSNVDLMERVCHLTNKIYRGMLSTTKHERMTIITIRGLDRIQVRAFSWTTQYRIVLSWDLLAWISAEGRIPYSFTKYITSPESSGSLYISPDIYHTQITEYSLMTFYQPSPFCYGFFIIPDWSFMDHLARALPTEMIFFLLRSIPSECLMRASGYSAELMLEYIIKWLQALGSERPSDLYDRFQGELQVLPQPCLSDAART